MGIHNWLFASQERAVERADERRTAAVESPSTVNLDGLFEQLRDGSSPEVTRLAADGVLAVAREEPERLLPYLEALVTTTGTLSGPTSEQRATAAEALRHVATAVPYNVRGHEDRIVESLEREVETGSSADSDVQLDEKKIRELCEVLVIVDATTAEPSLRAFQSHPHPAVSSAAAAAADRLA